MLLLCQAGDQHLCVKPSVLVWVVVDRFRVIIVHRWSSLLENGARAQSCKKIRQRLVMMLLMVTEWNSVVRTDRVCL